MSVDLKIIADYLKLHQIDLHNFDADFVVKTLNKRINSIEVETYEDYCKYLKNNIIELSTLKKAFYINYSEFFRNSLTFSYLEHIIIPEIIRQKQLKKNKEIRIWSMATANGMEAYSIAILLDEIISKSNSDISYRIFATDIVSEEIEYAQKGVYKTEEIENISNKRLNTYFTQKNNKYIISSKLKENINFSCFDVVSDQMLCPEASIFGDFDLIFCCNILFYYNSNIQNTILKKANNCISSYAYLITGEVEKDIVSKSKLFINISPTAIFKAKR
jgi:chemotaxis protein methyltransferase CheR